MFKYKGYWLIWFFLSVLVSGGCMMKPSAPWKTSSAPIKPISPLPATPAPLSEGSLYSPQMGVNWYTDVKARNVGDIVTINIVESSRASKNASTKTSRNSEFGASWSGVLSKLSGNWFGDEHKASFDNEFEGKGETTRSSQLNAYITAQVIQVLPNGNLVINGSREVRVNNENQYINIQGIVRPEDISANNIVLSTFIAEAKIELTGQGVIADKQRAGWFTRILDWIWPF